MTKASPRNAIYGQAGGVTAIINASARGVIEAVRAQPDRIGRMLVARDGILGIIEERICDTASLSDAQVASLSSLPGGAFGACRYDIATPEKDPAVFDRIFAVLAAHQIGYFFYNGGNGSQDTALQLHRAALQRGYPLACIGIPKTVDNDIVNTDCCPGFGSAAKYLASSLREMAIDLASMHSRKPRLLVVEVMGRNTGWLAAATTLARRTDQDAPHAVLMPERAFDAAALTQRVADVFARQSWCVVVVSEGARHADGRLLAERGHDAAGHVQLGGAGQVVAETITARLDCRYHIALPDYMQRAARHLASAVDLEQAQAVGRAAVELALAGQRGVMPAIVRDAGSPYRWQSAPVPLDSLANLERSVPDAFIAADSLDASDEFRAWCAPLILGEAPPPFRDGLPDYPRISLPLLDARLPPVQRA